MNETGTAAFQAALNNFHGIRYAQCWEDADILLQASNIREGDTVLSISSAGDNTLALLTRNPGKVIAIDLSRAQLACLELRMAGFRTLTYPQLLCLLGLTDGNRIALYKKCRWNMSPDARSFWDMHQFHISHGVAASGRFEQYFKIFRTSVLPLTHSRRDVEELLVPKNRLARLNFYHQRWNNLRWRSLFSIFFSRQTMGMLGRDPSFFQYVEGSVSQFLKGSTEHALTELDPSANPYLSWILTGRYSGELPLYLRPENFAIIKANIDKIELRRSSLEDFAREAAPGSINAFNLSDVFEYISLPDYHKLLELLVESAAPGARFVYWNMMAPRTRPEYLRTKLTELTDLSESLYRTNKTFFYSRLVIEEKNVVRHLTRNNCNSSVARTLASA